MWEAGSAPSTIFLGRDGPPTRGSLQVPDELRFRVHVAHTVLCKPLVQTVECGSQEAPNDPHHDEETQIHSCPEVTFFIRVRALREGGREGERKTRVAMRTGRERDRDRNKSGCLASLLRAQAAQAHCSWVALCRNDSHSRGHLHLCCLLESKFHGSSEMSSEG